MDPRRVCIAAVGVAIVWVGVDASSSLGARPALKRSVLVAPKQVSKALLKRENREGLDAVILLLPEGGTGKDTVEALERVKDAGLKSGYWIEIGRSPALAREHPEWMASLQGHPEWRRRFPKAAMPAEGEVIKNFPWVPVLFNEAFEAHRQRVKQALKGLPRVETVYLNDLQGPPSACGCGNDLCRWTADYGPIHTATDAGPDAAARFVQAVRVDTPGVDVIPVWTSECEEAEGGKSGHCAGVACFPGRCWRDFTQQLMPVSKAATRVGVLATAGTFGKRAEWVDESLQSFQKMPPVRGGEAIPMSRLDAVVQAWDMTLEKRRDLIRHLRQLGVTRCVEALTPIEQGWTPVLYRLPAQ